MSKTLKILLAVVVALLILAVVGKQQDWFGKTEGMAVETKRAELKTIVETVSANGKIQPEVEVKISPDVSGEITELAVKEGDDVKQGDLLAKIKPDVYMSNVARVEASVNSNKANLANAKARFLEAESNFKRNKKLWDEDIISDADFDAIKASLAVAEQTMVGAEYNVKSASASLNEAMDNLAKTMIFAPVSGTVYMLGVEKGERVVGTSQMAGTAMMRLANLNQMEVSVEVNENDIVRVEVGDTAEIEVDSYLDRDFKGLVTEVANSANTDGVGADQVTNFTVKIRILQHSYDDLLDKNHPNVSPFRPGMSATVEIQTETAKNVVSVPIQAVTLREDTSKTEGGSKDGSSNKAGGIKGPGGKKECVFIVDGEEAKRIWVKTGIQDNDNIEIKEGISSDQEVITGPYSAISKKLKDGREIQIKDQKDIK